MKTPVVPLLLQHSEKPAAVAARSQFPARLGADKSAAVPAVRQESSVKRPVGVGAAKELVKPTVPGLGTALGKLAANHVGSYLAVRTRMVQKLADQGVTHVQVLASMGSVKRHHFVDTALAAMAYEDTSLPIGLGQTISKPNVVARMLELLMHGLQAKDGRLGRVLEIGTGCGYQAALLSQLATEVYSMERLRGLHDKARENLRTLRLPNVHLLFGDGMPGYPKGAPYAAIIAAAGGEAIPVAWTDQLAVGGRLVAPLQDAKGAQALLVIDKTSQGLRQSLLEAVHFVPLKSGIG